MEINLGKKLQIYFTSDTHGFLLPVDYGTGRPAKTGLLGCAASFSKEAGTLVIDGGDTLQGSPLASYLAHQMKCPAPIASAFNLGNYDYITLGNHDFNHGLSYLNKYLNEINARCICANVFGELPVIPWVVHTLETGLRIGITGIVTDYVNFWEEPSNLENITIGEPFAAAAAALQSMKGQTDVTICIYHGGFEADLRTGELLNKTTENIGCRICRELDFDLLLTGHQHMPISGTYVHGTYTVQPKANAVHYVRIEGTVTPGGVAFTSEFAQPAPAEDITPPELTRIDALVQDWLDMPVGYLPRPLAASERLDMALYGSEIADFFNQIQLWASGAQVSCVSLGNEIKGFNQEAVSMRDVLANYVFPDTLITLRVSGAIIKEALERTVSYFDLDKHGKPVVSRRFIATKIEHYNFDFFAGLTYLANLQKPLGERITAIYLDGNELNAETTFTMATSRYRARGGGGYEMYLKCPVLHEGTEDMSELIAKYFARHEKVEVWRFPANSYTY